MHGVGRPKNYDIRAVQTHAFHERRASARRGSVIRTLPGENRARFADDATDEQERRWSARSAFTQPSFRGLYGSPTLT
jgi:hypothetical protein